MDSRPYTVREAVGFLAGLTVAPVFGAIAWLRRARVFHPVGLTYRAEVIPLAPTPALSRVADRLAGSALVRLSEGLWKDQSERPDVLGIAIRFGECDTGTSLSSNEIETGSQDLLMVTSPSIFTLPLALLTTDQHDFLNNTYYAMAQFQVEGVGYVHLRINPHTVLTDTHGRAQRLEEAVARGEARFVLEMRTPGLTTNWLPVVEVHLTARVDVDQEALRFSPFRNGLGIVPRGFLNAMRPAAYAASQFARPKYSSLDSSAGPDMEMSGGAAVQSRRGMGRGSTARSRREASQESSCGSGRESSAQSRMEASREATRGSSAQSRMEASREAIRASSAQSRMDTSQGSSVRSSRAGTVSRSSEQVGGTREARSTGAASRDTSQTRRR